MDLLGVLDLDFLDRDAQFLGQPGLRLTHGFRLRRCGFLSWRLDRSLRRRGQGRLFAAGVGTAMTGVQAANNSVNRAMSETRSCLWCSMIISL